MRQGCRPQTIMTPMLPRIRRWIFCFVAVVAVSSLWIMPKFWSATRPASVPYGVVFIPGTDNFGTQDFAYNLNYLRQIWRKTVDHPYRLPDQEQMVKAWYPRISFGLLHAYSPVALVMALPLLMMKVEWAYFFCTFLNAALLVLLTWFYLLPRMKNSVQACAVLASFLGYVLFDVFLMGQTSIVTTSLLAAGFVLLENRSKRAGRSLLFCDLVLGIILFILAAKPSVAMILIAMLIGEGIWRSLILAGAGLALTWMLLANHYGGYWTGLQDYLWLINHYCQADMTPFMRPGLTPAISTNFTSYLTVLFPAHSEGNFLVSRLLFQGLILVLVMTRWMKRISLSTQFQGLLWTFLLFCPYLLVTEDFAVCLLAVGGAFFRPGPGAFFKVLLVLLLVNMCMGTWTTLPLFFSIKLALALWWLADLIVFQPRLEKPAPMAA
jgi:hypothetical protein